MLVEYAGDDSVHSALYLAGLMPGVLLAGATGLTADQQEELQQRGVGLVEDILCHPGAGRVMLDVWTSETDARVIQLRSQGVLTSCVADWILQHRREHVVGITGTAGKTTTTWLVHQLLRCAGLPVRFSTARAANLWPTSQLLGSRDPEWVVAELTSSHLAFCHHSPRVAAITNFWPDHLELHGSLAAYRAAKQRIFDWQQPDDVAVLPADDEEAAALATGSPARRAWFSQDLPPPAAAVRVWSVGDRICVHSPAGLAEMAIPPQWSDRVRLRALLCALAVSLSVGPLGDVAGAVEQLKPPPHRGHPTNSEVIDDTLAATPRKAAAGLRAGTHLVAGGLLEVAGRPVHASQLEQAALADWLDAIQRLCASVDLFGPAGRWLAERLAGLPILEHAHVLEAVRSARGRSGGKGRVLVAPGFPMVQEDREAVAGLSS